MTEEVLHPFTLALNLISGLCLKIASNVRNQTFIVCFSNSRVHTYSVTYSEILMLNLSC